MCLTAMLFNNNIERDKTVQRQLVKQGIKCIVIWECAIEKMKKDCEERRTKLNGINSFFDSTTMYIEI